MGKQFINKTFKDLKYKINLATFIGEQKYFMERVQKELNRAMISGILVQRNTGMYNALKFENFKTLVFVISFIIFIIILSKNIE